MQLTEHPPACPAGHDYIPGGTVVGWQPCMCQGGTGHRTYWCAEHDVEVMVPVYISTGRTASEQGIRTIHDG